MEHRTRTTRVEPAQPEREVTVIGSYYTCDSCGVRMPQYNSTHWMEEGMVPRSHVRVGMSRDAFSGESSSDEWLSRDFCDACFPGVWARIVEVLGVPEVGDDRGDE